MYGSLHFLRNVRKPVVNKITHLHVGLSPPVAVIVTHGKSALFVGKCVCPRNDTVWKAFGVSSVMSSLPREITIIHSHKTVIISTDSYNRRLTMWWMHAIQRANSVWRMDESTYSVITRNSLPVIADNGIVEFHYMPSLRSMDIALRACVYATDDEIFDNAPMRARHTWREIHLKHVGVSS